MTGKQKVRFTDLWVLLLFKLCDEAKFSDDAKKLVANTQDQLQEEAAQAALAVTAPQSATARHVTEPNV